MIENEKISITTQGLVALFVLSGSVKKAREVAKEYDIPKEEIEQIIKAPKTILDKEKYQDQQFSLLNEIVHNAKQANKVVRFESESKDKGMQVYPGEGSTVIVEYLQSKNLTFLQMKNSGLSKVIGEFYGLDSTLREDPVKIRIGLSEELYDELHSMEAAELEQMSVDEKYDSKTRIFLKDFIKNHQQVSKFLFKERKNKSSKWQDESGMFLVPGESYIWHITIDEPDYEGIMLYSNHVSLYVETAQKMIIDFLMYDKPQAPQNENKFLKNGREEAKFSLKRGFSFLWKSNLFLLVAYLFLFINKSSWGWDGQYLVMAFVVFWEVVILICSFIACFRDRESV